MDQKTRQTLINLGVSTTFVVISTLFKLYPNIPKKLGEIGSTTLQAMGQIGELLKPLTNSIMKEDS